MRKFLTTGLFGVILGLLVGAPADASLISRSFLDQALTDYATTTALDLKANQSDFTDLNTEISGSVDVLRDLLIRDSSSYEFVKGIDPEKFPNTISGAFGLLYQYLDRFASSILYGWTDSNGTYYAGFADLNNGWTDSEKKTYLGVKGLNDKIGDAWPYDGDMSIGLHNLSWGLYLPEIDLENASDLVRFLFGGEIESGINQGGVLNILGESVLNTGAYDINTGQIDDGFRSLSQLTNGWADSEGNTYLGVKGLNDKIGPIETKIGTLPDTLPFYEYDANGTLGYNKYPTAEVLGIKDNIGGMLAAILQGFDVGSGRRFLSLPEISTRTVRLSDQIGTLPSGSLLNQTPFTDELYRFTQGTDSPVYPNSMAELVKQIYGEFSSSGNKPGLVHLLITGFLHNGSLPVNSDEIGILPAMSLAETASSKATTAQTTANTANETAQANAAKIGTLPSGRLHMRLPGFSIFESAGITAPFNYPTSLSDLFLYLFGSDEDTTKNGLFPVIGTWVRDISAQIDSINITSNAIQSKIGTVPNGKNLAGMISETDAKIGTLPDGYETVGAALTAIKGIAEDAKAAALAAIPDPKTEGSTGKYVLTVDIVGDNATYRWEKIDREGETTTTTE